jgi:hypothetical protein
MPILPDRFYVTDKEGDVLLVSPFSDGAPVITVHSNGHCESVKLTRSQVKALRKYLKKFLKATRPETPTT